MKKILFLVTILLIAMLVVSCTPTEKVSDEELEKELAQLPEEELAKIADEGDKAIAGLASAQYVAIGNVKVTKKKAAFAAKSVLEKKKQGFYLTQFDIILDQYKNLGLPTDQVYKDLLYSNTLLYDSRKDLYLFWDLKTINSNSATSKEKTAAKINVEKRINEIYVQFDASSMKNTAWLFAAEKFYKDMLFENSLKANFEKMLVSPDGLKSFLEKQGAGGAMSGGSPSQGLPPLPSSYIGSMISCLNNYKKTQQQQGQTGGKGGSTGGGAGNPASTTTTEGGEGGTDTSRGGMGNDLKGKAIQGKGCGYGVDMGKLMDYAGQGGPSVGSKCDGCGGLTKEAGWSTTSAYTVDGKTYTTTTTFKPDGVYKSGTGNYDTVTGKTTTQSSTTNKKGETTYSAPKSENFAGTFSENNKNYEKSKGEDSMKPDGSKTDTKKEKAGDSPPGSKSNKEFNDKVNAAAGAGKGYYLDSDSGNPCGGDVAGFGSCILGTQGKTAKQHYQDMLDQCVSTKSANLIGGEKAEGEGNKGGSITGGKTEGGSGKATVFSTQGACSSFGPGCMSYMNTLYGQGSGVKQMDDNQANPCGVDASEGVKTILQTLITDPADQKLGLSLAAFSEFTQKAATATTSKSTAATAPGGATSKNSPAASAGAGDCVGNSCN